MSLNNYTKGWSRKLTLLQVTAERAYVDHISEIKADEAVTQAPEAEIKDKSVNEVQPHMHEITTASTNTRGKAHRGVEMLSSGIEAGNLGRKGTGSSAW